MLLSTAIVLAIAMILAGWVNRDLIRIKIASVYARVAPKPGEANRLSNATTAPLLGDAPWALSALPECLTQLSESNGSLRYVRAHLPSDSERIVPPATLVYGDCTISIAGEQAVVRRGSDRLRIPPIVEFYRAGARLVTLRKSAQGTELRVYEPAHR